MKKYILIAIVAIIAVAIVAYLLVQRAKPTLESVDWLKGSASILKDGQIITVSKMPAGMAQSLGGAYSVVFDGNSITINKNGSVIESQSKF